MINYEKIIRKNNLEEELERAIEIIKANIVLLLKEGNNVKIKAEIFVI